MLASVGSGNEIVDIVTRLVIQLGIIYIAAKLGGEVAARYLRIPPVLGELGIGIIIGPYALGGLALYGIGPLFPDLHRAIPVSTELWAIGQIASIILLFVVGLEIDVQRFLKYAFPGLVVAIGGVVFPFIFGVFATHWMGFSGDGGLLSSEALFMGAILTATSVGITARVLADMGKLDSPEGVTIIAGAVVDDVLGILILTIVVGVSASGEVSGFNIAMVGVKAFAFWLILTGVSVWLAPYVCKLISNFKVSGAPIVILLGLAFIASGLAEMFGLAFIIGAFSIGLAFSRTDLAKELEEPLNSVYMAFVPAFFVIMGMLVDVTALANGIVFGIVITLLAVVGKVVGSGMPALIAGFNRLGGTRIGFGMLPRGEVALIIAGIGMSNQIIGPDLFGVSILMTLVTTLVAPMALIPLFKNPRGGTKSDIISKFDSDDVHTPHITVDDETDIVHLRPPVDE